VVFIVVVNFVLGKLVFVLLQPFEQSYIIPVCTSHSQSTVSFLTEILEVAVADDIFKGIAAGPEMRAFPSVPFEMVRFGEVVPGAEEFYCSSSLWTITKERKKNEWHSRWV
jgi:hypothetical protein